jgi:hypothetical protein
VLLRLSYLALTGIVTFLRLLPMSSTDKNIEILTLRHQLAVLQRQASRPRSTPVPTGRSLPHCFTDSPDRCCGSFT